MLKVEIRSGKPRPVRKKYAQYMHTGANTRWVNTGLGQTQHWFVFKIGTCPVDTTSEKDLFCGHNFES